MDRRIAKLAADLLRKAEVKHPPVPVQDLAVYVGAVVRSGPLSEDLSGFLYRQTDAVIGVNSLHSRRRQRFTVAHELGHLLLHKYAHHVDRSISFYFRDSRSSSAEVREEVEANQFAAELLMPQAFLDKIITGRVDIHDEQLLEGLAKKFDVSTQALTYRLTNLGITFGQPRTGTVRRGTKTRL